MRIGGLPTPGSAPRELFLGEGGGDYVKRVLRHENIGGSPDSRPWIGGRDNVKRGLCHENIGGGPDSRPGIGGSDNHVKHALRHENIGGCPDSRPRIGGGDNVNRAFCHEKRGGGIDSRQKVCNLDPCPPVGGVPISHRWSGECGDSVSCPETGGDPETFQAAWCSNDCQQPHCSNVSHQSEPFDESIGLRSRASGTPRVGGKWKLGVYDGGGDGRNQTSDTQSTKIYKLSTKDLHAKWWREKENLNTY